VRRLSIRILVALALCAACWTFIAVQIPRDTRDHPDLPAVALEQPALYRLEVALVVFYGGLLLVTPTFSGLIEGRLPIEISARGARFAERADQSAESTDRAVRAMEQKVVDLSERLTEIASEFQSPRTSDDKRKPPLPSKG
jgi:hypothetical protein